MAAKEPPGHTVQTRYTPLTSRTKEPGPRSPVVTAGLVEPYGFLDCLPILAGTAVTIAKNKPPNIYAISRADLDGNLKW
jgi:hypothetical protein